MNIIPCSNKQKRQLLSAAFSILLALISTGCTAKNTSQSAGTEQNTAQISITATFYPLYIMLENITDGVPVTLAMLAPPNTGCLHDYQITTRDREAITDCNILVANGAGMEQFLDRALVEKKDTVIVAAEGFPLVNGNPHVWVSPQGARYEVNRIADGLARLDPAHADAYRTNGKRYDAALSALSERMHASLDKYAGERIITFHEAFPYFAAEFKLNQVSVVEREPGTVPNARELADLISMIQKEQQGGAAVSLFAEPQYSSSAASVIADETGLTVYELDPCATGPMDKNAYITAMEKNMSVLVQAFSAGEPFSKGETK